ncbi:hypothetical protein BRCH_04487 [Candidatus Burkholderia brachyanthoides]|nr:hypothetical protein BRCH_04487 [Candidatus Burkholderia brachyanthoides]
MKKKNSETKGSLLLSALADVELQHTERAVAQLRTMKHHSSGTLNVNYWRERLASVITGYALVPAQKQEAKVRSGCTGELRREIEGGGGFS